MKKNILPVALLTGGLYYLYIFLRNKKDAAANLTYIPLDIAIDSARSRATNWFQIYYKIKLKLVNNANTSVNVNGIDLNVKFDNNVISQINNNSVFTVPANGNKTIELTAAISTVGFAASLLSLLENNPRIQITVTGEILTNLGIVDINFTRDVIRPTL
jgi:hypothetical protein